MRAIIYKGLETKPSEEIKLKEGKLAPQLKHLGDHLAISGGQKCGKNYCVKKNDIITVRVYAGAPALIVVTILAIPFVVVGIVKLVNLFQDLKKASQRKTINRKVESLPYLGGAENQLATGQTQPVIIGEHLFTPYFIDYPLSRISGTDGRDQFTYRVYELGFKEQVIKEIKAGKASLKKFSLSEPQEGKFNLDATSSLYDADAFFEITQGGEFLTEEFNKKYYHLESGAILPKKKDGVQGELNFELPANSKYIEVAILFNGLVGYSDDGSKTSRSVEVKPQYSLDGTTWTTFAFDGATNNVFTRITQEQIRFTGRKTFTYAEIKNQTDIIKVRLLCPTVASTKQGYDDCYCVYVQAELFNVEESKKQNKFVAEKRLPDKQRALSTRLGLKIKATEDNQDKLGQINVITQGVAPTPAGNWINKTPTSNPASWLYEILTSETHPLSAISKDEIDLASFTDLFYYCEDEGLDVNAVLIEARPKQQVLEMVLRLCNSVLYRNMTGQLQVATDKLNSQPIALFTSQNVLSTTIDKNLERKTDGVLINYIDSSLGYEQASHLVMHQGEAETPDSVISTVQTEGITNHEQVVKFGRRLLATENLRPKTVKVQTSLEGVFYTPMSKVLLQTETLKTGKGNGEIKKLVIDDNDIITHLELYDSFEFTDNETNIIVVSMTRFGGNFTHTVVNFEIASAEGKLIELATPISSSHVNAPKKGDTLAYGVATEPIISEMIIAGVEENANGYTLTLVDYNEAIYDTGEIPEYKPSWASDIGDKPPATLPPLTLEDVQTYVELEAPDTPTITAIAQKNSLRLSASVQDGAKNGIAKIEWSLKKDGAYEQIGISRAAEFVYTLDDYYEAADFATWRVKAKVYNANGKGTESLAVIINTDTYGTWILNPPTVTNSTSKRSVILQLSTPSGSREQYSTIQYRVQVQKAGDDTWYKPDLVSDPYEDENNYKDGEGYETVTNTFIQSVPMESQEAGIKTTAYNYRIVGVSVETQAESEPTIITATATASTAMDIYDSSIGVEKLAVNDLSAISGTFGDIKSDEIEKDATNFWILSKSNSSLGYGRAGEFCVGTTASVEPFDLATNPTGYKENDEFLHYIPSKTGSTLKGLFLKLANFIVDAIASTIRGRFRVRGSTATMAQSVLVVNPESTVDPETNTPANTTDIKTALRCHAGITGNLTGTFSGGGSTVDNAIISIKESFGVVNSSFHGTGKNDLSVVEESAEKGFVEVKILDAEEGDATDFGGVIFKDNGINKEVHSDRLQEQDWNTAKSWAEETRSGKAWRLPTRAELSLINPAGAWWTGETSGDEVYIWEGGSSELVGKQGLVDIASFFNASRMRLTSQLVDTKIYIPQSNGTGLEIIDTTTDTVTTLANFFNSDRARYTSQLVGTKIYIPEYFGTGLEIIDTSDNTVTTIANFFNSGRARWTSQLVGTKIYIPQRNGTVLEIIDTTNNTVTTIANFFNSDRTRYTSQLVGTKIYTPQSNGTGLEIIDTSDNTVTTLANFFNASRDRWISQLVGTKIYIPEYNGTALEIIDTTNNTVTTIDSFFNASRDRRTSQLVDGKLYIPEMGGTALEIIDTTTDTVTTIANFFNGGRARYTSQLVGTKIYIPEYSGTGLEIIHTANTLHTINTLPVRNNTETQRRQVSSSSDGTTWTIRSNELITAGQTFTSYFGLKLRFAGDTHKVGDYWRYEQDEMGAFSLQDSSGEEYVRAMNGKLHVKTLVGELAKPKFTGKIKTEKAMNKVIFYDEDDEVVNPVNAIAGIEIGDVVWIKYEGYDKLHTVELLEAGYMIVNYEHCDTRGKGSLMLEDKTNVSATVELLTKWYNAPLGLGQAWVDVTLVRGGGVTYINNTGRSIKAIANRNSSASDARAMFVDGVKIKEQSAAIVDGYRTSVNIGDVVPKDSTYLFGNSLGQGTSFNGFYELR